MRTYPSSAKGIQKLVSELEAATLIVVEATGGYERELVDRLLAAERPVVVVNRDRSTRHRLTSIAVAG